jgi:cyclopropane-fatty-acyl-phospholipid synthase
MEALGHKYLPAFCDSIGRLLKPAGIAAFQYITCPDSRYEEFRRGVDFIQKHIFPGSLLLSINRVNQLMTEQSGFQLHRLEEFGLDYARTLDAWCQAFEAQLDQVRAMGFDERFIRKWRLYFRYCEAAFAHRNIGVVQAVYVRPNHPSL